MIIQTYFHIDKTVLLFIHIIIMSLLMSCSPDKDGERVEAEVSISVNLSSPDKEMGLSEFIDSVTIVRLILPDSLVFGMVRDFLTNRKYYYISDSKQHVVFRFNRNGEYLNTIGRVGGGPGEYTRLGNCFLGDSCVFIDDLNIRKIFCYTPEGEFIRSVSFPFNTVYNDIVFLPNGDFLCQDLSCSEEFPERGLWVMNNKGEKISTILETKEIYPYIGRNYSTLFKESDTIIRAYNPSSGEFYSFNWDNKILRKTYQLQPDIRMLSDFKGHTVDNGLKAERADCIMAIESRRYLFAFWGIFADEPTGRSVYTLYDKQAKRSTSFSKLKLDFEQLFSLGAFISSNIPNALVTYLSDEYTQKLFPEEYKRANMGDNVLVLQIMHFKP